MRRDEADADGMSAILSEVWGREDDGRKATRGLAVGFGYRKRFVMSLFKKFESKPDLGPATALKSSVRRVIRQKLTDQYPELAKDEGALLEAAWPNKASVTTVKFAREHVQMLIADKQVLFFQHYDDCPRHASIGTSRPRSHQIRTVRCQRHVARSHERRRQAARSIKGRDTAQKGTVRGDQSAWKRRDPRCGRHANGHGRRAKDGQGHCDRKHPFSWSMLTISYLLVVCYDLWLTLAKGGI
ncbi:hypothetical protein [Sporisorium scitamineum]|uniref:Pre-PUA domain-containing protein n=1 Tax=Sporisorium scitamineum TaxID=49012 RepID=A0A0F7S456_9BASI|nr:hypothetical protein [Sporisorium scitamineum]